MTRDTWQWFGPTIVSSAKGKPVVICAQCDRHAADLATNGPDGVLTPLTEDHPIARLIIAAPDLLDALEIVQASYTIETPAVVRNVVDHAILKARGK